ncbi:MAG: C40 family peptidase [Actinomycetota bacterium]|nr:C40 family peptidase [Actinomycetota bacterium]
MRRQSLNSNNLKGVFRATGRRVRVLVLAALVVATAPGLIGGPAQAHEGSNARSARAHIVRRARSQIGVRYRYGSESPSKGFDCSGLTSWVFSGHGASLPRTSLTQYQLPGIGGYKRVKKRSELKKGDLVFFKTTSAIVGHVGIYVGDGDMVSATSSSGVRESSIFDSYWGPRWVGATRAPLG